MAPLVDGTVDALSRVAPSSAAAIRMHVQGSCADFDTRVTTNIGWPIAAYGAKPPRGNLDEGWHELVRRGRMSALENSVSPRASRQSASPPSLALPDPVDAAQVRRSGVRPLGSVNSAVTP